MAFKNDIKLCLNKKETKTAKFNNSLGPKVLHSATNNIFSVKEMKSCC